MGTSYTPAPPPTTTNPASIAAPPLTPHRLSFSSLSSTAPSLSQSPSFPTIPCSPSSSEPSQPPSCSSPARSRLHLSRPPPPGKVLAAYIHSHGRPATALRIAWVDRPSPSLLPPRTALVRVHSAAVTACDVHLRRGTARRLRAARLPRIPGRDFAGTVLRVRTPVEDPSYPRPGDRVFGMVDPAHGYGSFAELAFAPLHAVCCLPDTVSFAQGAVLASPILVAYAALLACVELRAGERVLVFGATGAVGQVVVQMARGMGAVYVAAVCSGKNARFVRTLGAGEVFDRKLVRVREVIKRARPDVVVDASGKGVFRDAVRDVAPQVRFIAVSGVEALGKEAEIRNIAFAELLHAVGCACWNEPCWVMPHALDVSMQVVGEFVKSGILVRVCKEFKLRQVAAAHALQERGRLRGAAVVNVV